MIRALVAVVPVGMLLAGAFVLFCRRKTVFSLLQLVGAGCLMVVALAHVSEALHLAPGMRWGLKDSAGHYLDLLAAVFGLTLFPVGYLVQALKQPHYREGERGWEPRRTS